MPPWPPSASSPRYVGQAHRTLDAEERATLVGWARSQLVRPGSARRGTPVGSPPPVGTPLGLTPLVMMVGGLVGGLFQRVSSHALARAVVALAAAGLVVLLGRLASAVVAEGSVALSEGVSRLAATVVVGVLVLPLLLGGDQALVRRRLG